MNSLTTIEQIQFKNTNPIVLVRVIRALHNLTEGTGFGRITIFMKDGRITMVESLESDKVEEKTIVDK